MTISSLFIRRPRLAFVVSTVITIAGLIAMTALPVAQFPDIVPPQVRVTATYPGASAQAVEESVAQVIEAQVNGVERMIYMKSTSGGDGSYTLTVSFEVGSNPDINTVNVNNRVNQAVALLPPEVQRLGVTTKKQSSALLQVVAVYSPKGTPRRAVPVELRHHHAARHAAPRARRRRRHAVRRARLLDARLAQPRPHVEPRHHARRRGQGGPGAERPGRRRPGRRGAAARRCRLPAQHHHAGPPDHGRGVREHRRARHLRRRAGPGQGHRPGRARRQDQRSDRPLQRQAGRRHPDLPAARRQCAGHRQGRARGASRSWSRAFPTMSPTTSCTTRRCSWRPRSRA